MSETRGAPPRLLRAFREAADPARWRLYKVLGLMGPMKSSTLARMVGVTDSLMRRHLETMSEVGLVEHTGEGRGRRWQQVLTEDRSEPSGLRVLPSDEYAPQVFASTEFSEFLKVLVATGAGIVTEFIDRRMELEPPWRDATEVQDYVLYLRCDELDDLGNALQQVVRERLPVSRDRLDSNDPEARPVYVSTHAVLWPSADTRQGE